MVKLQYDQNGQFKITLPKQIAVAKGWKKGDTLRVKLNDKGNLVLEKDE